jgi:hypothetical protein
MCITWDAVVNDDWTMIMPIPTNKKMGIEYVPIIPFIQQLGIFYSNLTNQPVESDFFIAQLKKYRLVNYNLNYGNFSTQSAERKNYVLSLHKSYAELAAQYKTDFSKYLKQNKQLVLDINTDYITALQLFAATYGKRMPQVTTWHYAQFKKLLAYYKSINRLQVYNVLHNNNTVAAAIFLHDVNRIYNLASVILPEGRSMYANHFLYDAFIKNNANTLFTLDLEGGDIEGIAHFYKNLGGQPQHYPYYEHNNLSWIVNWLRKWK